jgi:KTSC domain
MNQDSSTSNDRPVEMKKISSGKLRAIGYDARAKLLQVQLDDGSTLQYGGVGEEAWRRLSTSSSAWSYYRDNIEEEFTAKRVSPASTASCVNPLDELFGKS